MKINPLFSSEFNLLNKIEKKHGSLKLSLANFFGINVKRPDSDIKLVLRRIDDKLKNVGHDDVKGLFKVLKQVKKIGGRATGSIERDVAIKLVTWNRDLFRSLPESIKNDYEVIHAAFGKEQFGEKMKMYDVVKNDLQVLRHIGPKAKVPLEGILKHLIVSVEKGMEYDEMHVTRIFQITDRLKDHLKDTDQISGVERELANKIKTEKPALERYLPLELRN